MTLGPCWTGLPRGQECGHGSQFRHERHELSRDCECWNQSRQEQRKRVEESGRGACSRHVEEQGKARLSGPYWKDKFQCGDYMSDQGGFPRQEKLFFF